MIHTNLGTVISHDLKWDSNISSLTKKAHQRICFLRRLTKCNLPLSTPVHFYAAAIEAILTPSISVWYPAATAKGRLRRVIRTAERAIGCSLPPLLSRRSSATLGRTRGRLCLSPSRAGRSRSQTLPSGSRLRSIRSSTSHHKNSVFPCAVSLLNKADCAPPTHARTHARTHTHNTIPPPPPLHFLLENYY